MNLAGWLPFLAIALASIGLGAFIAVVVMPAIERRVVAWWNTGRY